MKITESAKTLLNLIKKSGDLARAKDFNCNPAWDELIAADMLNCWTDDAGTEFVEAGRQQ